VLRAARSVFAERGYSAATTRDILFRSGTTSPTLHHHFGTKAGLYLAVLHEVTEQILASFEAAIEGRSAFLDRLDAILDASVTINKQDPAVSRLIFAAPVEVRQNPELESGAARVGSLTEFVEQMCRTSTNLPVDPVTATQAVMTVIYGLGRSAITLDPDEYEDVVAAVRALAHGQLAKRLPQA
jgi:AcrR family transcriptional regulator